MRNDRKVLSLMLAAACGFAGCGTPQETQTEYVPEVIGEYEAEDGVMSGNVSPASKLTVEGYSGSGYVEGFTSEGDSCTFRVSVADTGFYDLNFVTASCGGEKTNYVLVDDVSIGTIYVNETAFTDSVLSRVYLESGEHTVTISEYWGYIRVDKLQVITSEPLDPSLYEVECALSNPNADENTLRLYSYLLDIYGEKFLSGQYCDSGRVGKEMQVIKTATGKTPAVLGLDLIDYSPSRAENGTVGRSVEYAIDCYENGGIVTMLWHWNAPSKYLKSPWYSGFYTQYTDIDLEKIMNGEDEEGYKLLLDDIDAIAKELKRIADAGVPLLWRPLHEASGGWFWWGAKGPEAYKKLYILLYEKLTYDYGLNNLIWVWNGADADWYPGDEYVDIIGEDIYPGERVYSSQIATFLHANEYSNERKMVILSENGCIFDPELAKRDGAMWGMWCTWGGEFTAMNTNIYRLSEQYTEKEMLIKAYESEDVITLDELPDLRTYPIRKAFLKKK